MSLNQNQELHPSALNAVRHGLAGTRHVPKEAQADVALIEADLVATKHPETPEDEEITKDLAVAMWQVGEHNRRHVAHVEMQIARAGSIYDDKAQESFRTLLANWQADPKTYAQAMAQSYHGAKHLAEIWKSVAESIGPDGTGLSLKMACEAVAAEGVNPHPESVHGEGTWIMKRFLATTATPDDSVKEWIAQYGAKGCKSVIDRAERHFYTAPDAGIAQAELHERAQEKYRFWDNLMQKRRKDYDLAKIQFATANAGNGMGDKELEMQMRLMHRYRVAAQNRVDKLERQLKNNKLERLRREQKIFLWEQKEKQRKENRDFQLSRMSSRQLQNYNEQVDNYERRQVEAWQAEQIHQQQAQHRQPFHMQDMKVQSAAIQEYLKHADTVEKAGPEQMMIAAAPTNPEVEDLVNEIDALLAEVFKNPNAPNPFRPWPDHLLRMPILALVQVRVNKLNSSMPVRKTVHNALVTEAFKREILERMLKAEAAQKAQARE